MNNVDLANGDSVGVACGWTPPDAFDGITTQHLIQAQKAIGAGKWRENYQAKAWAGHAIAPILDLDPSRQARPQAPRHHPQKMDSRRCLWRS
jgi:hypothetical protein